MVTGGRKPRMLTAGISLWFGKKAHPHPTVRSSLTGSEDAFGHETVGLGLPPQKVLTPWSILPCRLETKAASPGLALPQLTTA